MISQELAFLTAAAVSLGFFHTLLGPDHYLPFVAMARAKSWSLARTVLITSLCGLGHIGSSVFLGSIGIGIGLGVGKIEAWDSFRSELAAWGLIAFGFVYFICGMRTAWRSRPHAHLHTHENGAIHAHTHAHETEHAHLHGKEADITPWILFTVLILGPCEPLIPVLMYPAVQESMSGLVWITAIFGATTVATMTGIVIALMRGFDLIAVKPLERYTHALAGGTVCMCGIAVRLLGV